MDAAFIDDAHLMVLSRAGSGLMLTLSSGNGEVPAWQTFLPATHPPVIDRIGIGVAYERDAG